MSSRYRCKDCGFVWRDIAVNEGESNPFLRCIRCESRNIDFPKKVTLKAKLIIWLIISVITGIIGAGIMSTLSDKFRKRKIFILIALLGGVVFMPLLIFISNDIARYIFSFFMGFLLVSALPVGLTFAAEVTHPVPEETSNGLMMWIGQIVGVILLGGIMLTEYYNPNLIYINIIIMIVMFVIGVVLVFFMNDLDAYEKT